MIVLLDTPAKKRDARVKLYKDDVFLIAHEAVKKQNLSLSIEELFATADIFTSFLLDNDLSERELMQYEIDDLRNEISDEISYYLLLTVTFVKLCALRKTKPNAEIIARALVGFCQEYDGFTDMLHQLYKKEQARWFDNKRADLLTYELKCIEKEVTVDDGKTIVTAIVDSALGLTPEGMQHVENTLSEVNDKFRNRYQTELVRLRKERRKKSESRINIDKVNDIHDNPNVYIGSK